MTESKKAQVARLLRADIDAGRLRDGQALPSTRELATMFGTSSYTIASAMDLLANWGYVEARDRSGRVVRAPQGAGRRHEPARPQLVLVGGYAGSGKTETGRALARLTGWAILDKDTTTRPVVERLLEQLGRPPHDRESDAYLSQVRPVEYEALAGTITENLECGVSVIATAPFVRELGDAAWMDRMRARVEQAGGRLTVVWVHCDPETMLTYVRRRGAARDTGKLARWPDYIDALDLAYRPHGDHVVIDNGADGEPLSEQVEQLVATLTA